MNYLMSIDFKVSDSAKFVLEIITKKQDTYFCAGGRRRTVRAAGEESGAIGQERAEPESGEAGESETGAATAGGSNALLEIAKQEFEIRSSHEYLESTP